MASLICGSIAFDTIMNFEGRFADQIMADQLHILNVSFIVPGLRRDFGGCAGNIAYSLKALGGDPLPMGTIGNDGGDYLKRFEGLAIRSDFVTVKADTYTAQAMIMTDITNNQITAFHPGAMTLAHTVPVQARADIRLGIIAPDGQEAMWDHAAQMHAAGIPFIFDPGQQLPRFDGQALRRFVELASWVAVNDYEAQMLCERTGWDLPGISRQVQGLVVTLGEQGSDVWVEGRCTRVGGFTAEAVVDPTGCGDAYRGALLLGLEQGWDLVRCAELGNRVGAIKIASRGPQNYRLDGLKA